jgi:hypothetical protein
MSCLFVIRFRNPQFAFRNSISFVGAGPRACPDFGQPQGVAPTFAFNRFMVYNRIWDVVEGDGVGWGIYSR